MIDPVSHTLLGQIRKEALKEDQKMSESGYWMLCPSCGRKVVKKELIKKGCYLCGWRGTAEEIKIAQAKQMSVNQGKAVPSLTKIKNLQSYRIKCPKCGREVIKEELEKKGCFICGYKPGRTDR
ncbi:MAG: hypothetical protein ACE5K3_08390 [bacterium]